MTRFLRAVLIALILAVMAVLTTWCAGALWFRLPAGPLARGLAAGGGGARRAGLHGRAGLRAAARGRAHGLRGAVSRRGALVEHAGAARAARLGVGRGAPDHGRDRRRPADPARHPRLRLDRPARGPARLDRRRVRSRHAAECRSDHVLLGRAGDGAHDPVLRLCRRALPGLVGRGAARQGRGFLAHRGFLQGTHPVDRGRRGARRGRPARAAPGRGRADLPPARPARDGARCSRNTCAMPIGWPHSPPSTTRSSPIAPPRC